MSELPEFDERVHTWRFDHERFPEPLVMDGLWSEGPMLMFAVKYLERNIGELDWFIEKMEGNLTATDLGPACVAELRQPDDGLWGCGCHECKAIQRDYYLGLYPDDEERISYFEGLGNVDPDRAVELDQDDDELDVEGAS